MDALTRREALGAGVVALTGLAGCSTGSGSSGNGGEQPRLDRIGVTNSLSESVSVDLQLELDGEVVFWRDVPVDAVDADDGGSVQGPRFEPPAFPGERGEWRVRARVRETDETHTTLFTNDTTAESCLALDIDVRQDGVVIMYAATHDCGGATAATTES